MNTLIRIATTVGALLPTLGCVTPVPMVNPSPKQIETSLSTAEVVRKFSNVAVLNDFEILLSDPVAGTLSIRRKKTSKYSGGTGSADFVSCMWPQGSIGDIHAVSSLTALVSVRRSETTSTVIINTRVTTEYPTLTGILSLPQSEKDCVSNEKLEALLLRELQG